MKLILFLLLLTFSSLFAQLLPFTSFSEKNPFFSKSEANIDSSFVYEVESPTEFSGLMIRIQGHSFSTSFVILAEDTVFLKHDNHHDSDPFIGSQLITCKPGTSRFLLYTDKLRGKIEIHFFNSSGGNISKKKANNYRQDDFCVEPSSISQSVWRAGLPDPIGTPVATPVQHIIVHHSAGSNIVEDDAAEVRNIYLLHTQSNGYDDIGYNYLIAPDGTIFKGRDGRGIVEQDNVRGAHMCNKNDSTMAICLLGTFTEVLPSTAALGSLFALAGWKTAKNQLDVFGSTYHSMGPTSAQAPSADLSNIAGHRDGCTPSYTECPGENLYQLLPLVRDSIFQAKNACLLTTDLQNSEVPTQLFSVNTQSITLPKGRYDKIILFNVEGKSIYTMPFQSKIQIRSGFYILRLEGETDFHTGILVH